MQPLIEVTLGKPVFALAERVRLRLSISNPDMGALLTVADPNVGDTLLFSLRRPDATTVSFSVGSARSAPGVRQVPADVRVPPGVRRDLEFDVAALTRLDQTGAYRLSIAYAWSSQETWTSPEQSFTISAPAGVFLEATPSESLETGLHGILWTEPLQANARVLFGDYRMGGPRLIVDGARQIATVPLDARPALSTYPAGEPFSERWLAWVTDAQLFTRYHADTVEHVLPTKSLALPGVNPRLVRPLLAERAPDEGRPGCTIGVVTGDTQSVATFVPVIVDRQGEARALPAIELPGVIVGEWATCPHFAIPTFVVATQQQAQLVVYSITCEVGGPCGAPRKLYSTDAELMAGDVRAMKNGAAVVGLLVRRGSVMERVTFGWPVPERGAQVAVSAMPSARGATALCARLDDAGQLHVVLSHNGGVQYVPPGEHIAWANYELLASGSSFDLLLRSKASTTLLYYDAARGPVLVRL
jgi:hypothetical protein